MRSLCSKTLGATAEAPARNAKRTQRRKPLGSRRALPRLEAGEGTLLEWKAVIMLSPESRAEAEQALAAAGALYEKAAAAHDAESADLSANIVALTRAIAAHEKLCGG